MAESLRPTCTVIRAQNRGSYQGKQGLSYFAGISAKSAGSQAICMHLSTIPPGGRVHAHLHEQHETAVYILSGQTEVWYGEELQEHLAAGTGEFVYIPAGIPHLPVNPSQSEPCVAVIARTTPNEQESVVLLPQLGRNISS